MVRWRLDLSKVCIKACVLNSYPKLSIKISELSSTNACIEKKRMVQDFLVLKRYYLSMAIESFFWDYNWLDWHSDYICCLQNPAMLFCWAIYYIFNLLSDISLTYVAVIEKTYKCNIIDLIIFSCNSYVWSGCSC